MDGKLLKFLDEQKIPESVQNLLELYGINYLEDLKLFDDKTIEEIEMSVRDDEFSVWADFSLPETRNKYLGSAQIAIESFKFRPMDKKKLLLLRTLAISYLEDEKSTKVERTESGRKLRTDRIAEKVLNDCNSLLSQIDECDLTLDESQIRINYDPVKLIVTGSVNCLLCHSLIKLNGTRYTVSVHNFSGHLKRVHGLKELKSTPGKKRTNRIRIKSENEDSELEASFSESDDRVRNKCENHELADQTDPFLVEMQDQDHYDTNVEDTTTTSTKELDRLEHITKKIVNDCNLLLSRKGDVEAKFNVSHVTVEYDTKRSCMSARVKCVLCDSPIKLNTNKYTASCQNFMSHLRRVHCMTDEAKLGSSNKKRKSSHAESSHSELTPLRQDSDHRPTHTSAIDDSRKHDTRSPIKKKLVKPNETY